MEKETIQQEELKLSEVQQPEDKQAIKIKIDRKTAIIIATVIILAALAYVSRGLFVAATVDGSPISRWSVISKLEKSSGKSLLESLITEKLVQNEAKSKKIVISDDEVNEEIKKIEDLIVAQGGVLDDILAQQGMTRADFKVQIILQKELESLVAEKTIVTDEEVQQYINDNKITVTAGQEATIAEQTKSELAGQKINQEAEVLIESLRSQAKINYFVNY